jgi:transposase-like protein
MENPFKWRHYQSEIILLTVRWYLRYSLSYRDLEKMMTERGLSVDHSTIYRWVQRYAPELDKRSRPYLKQTNDSCRVDETYVKVRVKWMCATQPFSFTFFQAVPKHRAIWGLTRIRYCWRIIATE